jgi:cytoskeletal protein RodZ
MLGIDGQQEKTVKVLKEGQEEQLKEIIGCLRQAREEKSISIEEIANQTLIRLAFLYALEKGQFEELPEAVYVQGFIRRYADAVNLDGNAFAHNFGAIFLSEKSSNLNEDVDRKLDIHIPLFVPYLLLLIAASFGLFQILNLQPKAESLSQNKNSRVSSKQKTATRDINSFAIPKVAKGIASTPTPKVSPTPQEEANQVQVTLEFQDESWVRIKVDGRTEFAGNLKKGERKTWTAKKELTVRSGNAGAVLVSANKKEAKAFGNPDEVKEVTFTIKS